MIWLLTCAVILLTSKEYKDYKVSTKCNGLALVICSILSVSEMVDAAYITIMFLLIAAAIVDIGFKEIPDTCSVLLLCTGLLNVADLCWLNLVFMFILFVFCLQGLIGFGDIKLLTGIALMLPPNQFLWLIFGGSCLALLNKGVNNEVPMGPWYLLTFVVIMFI